MPAVAESPRGGRPAQGGGAPGSAPAVGRPGWQIRPCGLINLIAIPAQMPGGNGPAAPKRRSSCTRGPDEPERSPQRAWALLDRVREAREDETEQPENDLPPH
eukprot:4237805-Pyramimonas_sp.AAC.1